MSVNYFTNFGFAGHELTAFHCTHTYLGRLENTDPTRIISLLNNFFAERRTPQFGVCFDEPRILNARRVLATASSNFAEQYGVLFRQIHDISPSEHDFCPHVTLPAADRRSEFTGLINRYVLVEKKNREITLLYARKFASGKR